MLNVTAKAGEAGSLADLPGATLEKLKVSGNGHFQIDREGHSQFMRWVRQVRPETALPFAYQRLQGLTAPIASGRTFDNARGGPGQAAGSPTGPIQFVGKLTEAWRLDGPDAVRLLGFDRADFEYGAAVLDGRRQLHGRDVRDRIACLFVIRRTLWSLFRDLDTENDWLRERHSMLNGASPLSLMLEGSMEDLLLARDYVEAAAGVR